MRTMAVAVVILSACFMQTVSGSFLRRPIPLVDIERAKEETDRLKNQLQGRRWRHKKEVATRENAHLTEAQDQEQAKKVDMQQELIRTKIDKVWHKVDQELTRKQQEQQVKYATRNHQLDIERAALARYQKTHYLQVARYKIRDMFGGLVTHRRKYDDICVRRKLDLKKKHNKSWFLFHNREDKRVCKELHKQFRKECEEELGSYMVKMKKASTVATATAEYCPYTEGSQPLCKSAINTMVSQFSKSMIKYKQTKKIRSMGEDTCRIMWSNHGKQLHMPSSKWSRKLYLKSDIEREKREKAERESKSKHQGSKMKHQRVNKRLKAMEKMNKDLAAVAAR